MKYLEAKALGGPDGTQRRPEKAASKLDRRSIADKMLRGPVADKTTHAEQTLDVQDQFVSLGAETKAEPTAEPKRDARKRRKRALMDELKDEMGAQFESRDDDEDEDA